MTRSSASPSTRRLFESVRWLMAVLAICAVLTSCSSSQSPTSPSNNGSGTQTRIIGLTGSLAFGQVAVGSQAAQTFSVRNDGNSSLTISRLTYSGSGTGSSVFTASATTGVVSPGGSLTITVFFSPTAAITYNGTLTVEADHTSGTSTLAVSGTGTTGTTTPPPAAARYNVSGTVTDSFSRGVLPNVFVEVASGPDAGRETKTDNAGRFTLSGLSGGAIAISVSATSYLTATRQLTLTSNTQLDFVIDRAGASSSGGTRTRIGALCRDGWISAATGSGACSSHNGVQCWRYTDGSCTNP